MVNRRDRQALAWKSRQILSHAKRFPFVNISGQISFPANFPRLIHQTESGFVIENLDLIVCGQEEKSPSDLDSTVIPTQLSGLSEAACNRHLLNTSAQFLAFVNPPQSAFVESLQHAVALLQADDNLNVVQIFPPAHRDSCEAWQKSPPRLAALRENPATRIAGILFRVSGVRELGFADVAFPIWDVIIRASQKPGSCQAIPLPEEFPQDSPLLPELAPQFPDRSWSWLKSHLDAVRPEDLVSQITSKPDGVALKAGLLQIHDYLDASHELSQSVEGRGRNAAGDYWHAIMHRREPDYSNSKYWFRNVGSHPVFKPLASAVDSLLSQSDSAATQTARQKLRSGDRWDPFAFVDFCQECNRGNDPELTRIAKQIQWAEMQLLLDQTYRDATA